MPVVTANVCPFCHELIVEPEPRIEPGDTLDFVVRRTLLIHEQNIRDHVRLEHPAVWPLLSRLAREVAEARA